MRGIIDDQPITWQITEAKADNDKQLNEQPTKASPLNDKAPVPTPPPPEKTRKGNYLHFALSFMAGILIGIAATAKGILFWIN